MTSLTRRLALGLVTAAALALPSLPAVAQTKLKWAHVYETSEPYHKWAVWAGEEFKKRTNNKYTIEVFPASSLGKESDINEGLSLGTVDIIISGSSFASREHPPIGVTYFPYIFRDPAHLIAYTKSDVFKRLAKGYEDKSGNVIEGNPDKVTDVTDVWTFARDMSSRDPNWKLVATEAGQ